MDTRTCTSCGSDYPLDKKHFRWRVKDGKGFFTPECLVCRASGKKRAKQRQREKREESLRRLEEAGADVFLATVASGGSNIPHSAEVIERVFQYFGGVGGFAAILVKQYYDSPPGSSARNRLLETMCRLVSKNVEQGGAKKPLSLWTEDELEKELNNRFEQAVAGINANTKVIDVKPQPAIEAAKAAEEASDAESACHAYRALTHGVPEGQPQGTAKRTEGAEGGGPSPLQAEREPREDSRLSGE